MSAEMTKVRQLIALATDPGAAAEEARTAAFLAVKLIRKHSLLDTDPPPPPPPPPSRPTSPSRDEKARPVKIHAKFPGTCRGCGRAFDAGDRVWWLKGVGSRHMGCYAPR